jgi:hypothetical protein
LTNSQENNRNIRSNGGSAVGCCLVFLSLFSLSLQTSFIKPLRTPLQPKKPSLSLSMSNIQKVFITYARVVMLRVESITTFISLPLVVLVGVTLSAALLGWLFSFFFF